MKRKHSDSKGNTRELQSSSMVDEDADGNASVSFCGGASTAMLYVVLENAQLESAKIGRNYELLSAEHHATFLKKNNKDPAMYRPDITHQCLLMLLDSPLNRAGRLRVYIHTARNVLIEVSPQCRIPRVYTRFAGLMIQLLHKLSIRASDGPQRLLKVIKNPIQSHLPIGCSKFGTSFHSDVKVAAIEWAQEHRDAPITVVIGAMAKGRVNVDYTERDISISSYPLSAALTCAKFCDAFEVCWGIN